MYTGARRLVPGTLIKRGEGVVISGPPAAAGWIGLVLEDKSIMDVYFQGSTMVLDEVSAVSISTDPEVTTAVGYRASVLV